MFSGSGTNFGSDNDVIIVGSNGARLYFSSYKGQQTGNMTKLEVLLDESATWVFLKDGNSRRARRFDILEVLAHVEAILVRATFTSSTSSVSIREVGMGSVSEYYTSSEFVLVIERATCPGGYQGLSCEVSSYLDLQHKI
jgi:hypothetical protein